MITNINELPKYISGIYIIRYDNNKIYIGQAINIRSRALEHNNKSKDLCDIALKKHTAIIEILEEINDISLLEELEQVYIKKYQATNREIGYNILSGGNASGKRGIENANAIFNQQTLNEVIDLLINHKELSLIDIANKYYVDQNTILRISKGQSYYNPNLKYPLRENDHSSMLKNNIQDYFNTQNELLQLKEDLLYRWDLTIEQDLTKKYNLPLLVIRDINQGRKFADIGDYLYPIRNKNIRNLYNFTQNDILNILNDLRNTKLSMTKIGEKYNLNRSTIARINEGSAYLIKNYDYPARKK